MLRRFELRRFELALPRAGADKDPRTLRIVADPSHYIPRLLQFRGLAHYERHTLACFLACLGDERPGDVFDIGGNVGVFSWLAAALGSRRVVAFEPFPALADAIETVAKDNELAIEVERRALGDEIGTAELFISNKSDCSHSLNAEFRRSGESVSVALDTVDATCARLEATPAIMKIDTETTEPAVLRGSRETLATHRPLILCEVLPGKEHQLTAVLAPLGYHTYQIGESVPLEARSEVIGSNLEEERNWLFAPTPPDEAFWQRYAHFAAALGDCVSADPRRPIEAPALAFAPKFADRWRPVARDRFRAELVEKSAQIASSLNEGERLYFFHGEKGFDEAGPTSECVAIEAGRQYEIEVPIEARGDVWPALRVFAFQFDDEAQVQSDRAFLLEDADVLVLPFDAAETAKTLRIVFQLTGPGTITLGPPRLSVLGDPPVAAAAPPRPRPAAAKPRAAHRRGLLGRLLGLFDSSR